MATRTARPTPTGPTAPGTPRPGEIEAQLSGFLAKYMPSIAEQASACRVALAQLIPRGYELVYDNYNALVFGYAPVLRTSQSLLSLALYPRWVTLFLLYGARLHDPHQRLEGTGKQVRSVRLRSSRDLDDPVVRELILAALQPAAAVFAQAPPLATVVMSVSARQRPRTPTGAKGR